MGTSDPHVQRSCLIKSLETCAQDSAYAGASAIETKITNAALLFCNMQGSSSSAQTLNSAMMKLTTQVKKEYLEKIDSIYEAAEDLGAANPDMQDDILNVTDKIGGYFLELFNKIAFVVPLVTDAITWIANMAVLIKNAFCAIREWIKNWFLEPTTV